MKWAPEGASASRSFPASTAIAAPTATCSTLGASVSRLITRESGCFMEACCPGAEIKSTFLSSAVVLT